MDPEATLTELRTLAAEIIRATERLDPPEAVERHAGPLMAKLASDAADMAERFEALDEWRRKGGFDPYSTKPKVVTLVIRDPDYENEHVEEVTGEVEIETIDIDLGSQFNGTKDFDADSDWGKEWIDDTRGSVAHLPEDGPIRQRVEELINHLTEED